MGSLPKKVEQLLREPSPIFVQNHLHVLTLKKKEKERKGLGAICGIIAMAQNAWGGCEPGQKSKGYGGTVRWYLDASSSLTPKSFIVNGLRLQTNP